MQTLTGKVVPFTTEDIFARNVAFGDLLEAMMAAKGHSASAMNEYNANKAILSEQVRPMLATLDSDMDCLVDETMRAKFLSDMKQWAGGKDVVPVGMFGKHWTLGAFIREAVYALDSEAGQSMSDSSSERNDGEIQDTRTYTKTECGFKKFFDNHLEGPGIHKWESYFPVYEEHFLRYCSSREPMRMMEIGIQSGGSLLMWRHSFGANLKLLLGVDVNPATREWERFGANVKVEIGSQANVSFLRGLRRSYPEGFDVILDDASHAPLHQFVTFVNLWPIIRPGGVYMIEDIVGDSPFWKWILHGHVFRKNQWAGLVESGATGRPNAMNYGGRLSHFPRLKECCNVSFPTSQVQAEIDSIKIYPYILAITKRRRPLEYMSAPKHGTQWIPYGKGLQDAKLR
eukprot:TRINITY_DN66759_c0_g1_i1.p1 TRINITY_DN66759_c0_g1~~TRINITY_DN66759_c0_g1_i1.p1  ORF type:complete len:466 (-),score=44.49 TRINITY_DN66759_c0_g1_i1:279-1478(-)